MALTKVDLANTVEGILPVANGGTGTSTGVAPGGSTTQVQYNNAGAFGGSSNFVYSSGNLGIGTSSPSGLGGTVLQVEAASNYAEMIINRTGTGAGKWGSVVSNAGGYLIRDYTASTNPFFIEQTTGNVGIGTTSPAYKLQISGVGTGVTSRIGITNTTTSSTLEVGSDGNGGFLATSGAYNTLFYTNGTERMRITSAGNVGIGTASPNTASSRLVFTVSDASAGGGGEIDLTVGSTTALRILTDGSYNTEFRNPQAAPLIFSTNNTERFRFGASGELGIGGANYGSSGQVLKSNGSGAAPSWGSVSVSGTAVAWVSFDNGGSIRASYNVSSIGVRGTGLWNVNFSSALADANYAMATSASPGNTMYNSGGCFCGFQYGPSQNYSAPSSSTAYIFTTQGTYTGGDARLFSPYITSCVFFR